MKEVIQRIEESFGYTVQVTDETIMEKQASGLLQGLDGGSRVGSQAILEFEQGQPATLPGKGHA